MVAIIGWQSMKRYELNMIKILKLNFQSLVAPEVGSNSLGDLSKVFKYNSYKNIWQHSVATIG